MELADLYRHMARARAFELALAELWHQGHISGEMHLGTGEEAVAVGIGCHLQAGDAVALDHRPTPLLAVMGVDLVTLFREMLGSEEGLCRGRGGHMHLLVPDRLIASSGIVGAAGPLGAGFALAAQHLRPGTVAVAFFGDGAVNQGMLMEAQNLAAVWSLPLLFVCKDNGWAITTRSANLTGGDAAARARAMGLATWEVDGLDVEAVSTAAGEALSRTRQHQGPAFLLARCSRLDGHLLGDPLRRLSHHPVAEGKETVGKIIGAALSRKGGGVGARAAGMLKTLNTLRLARQDQREGTRDPLSRARTILGKLGIDHVAIDEEVTAEVARAATAAQDSAA